MVHTVDHVVCYIQITTSKLHTISGRKRGHDRTTRILYQRSDLGNLNHPDGHFAPGSSEDIGKLPDLLVKYREGPPEISEQRFQSGMDLRNEPLEHIHSRNQTNQP